MTQQFADNDNEKKIGTGILIKEYKAMIDQMLLEDNDGTAVYVPYQNIKDKFLRDSK